MIVDIHTRIWESTEQLGQAAQALRRRGTEPWNRPSASLDDHAEAMKPVDDAIVLGLESRLLGASITHEQVAGYVRRRPEKYLGFAGIDPSLGRPVASLEQAVGLGLVGVVISPAAGGFHPADTRAMALYEACEARGMPVLIESAAALARDCRMEFAQPYLLDEVARSFPNLKLVISNMGHPWGEQTLALLAKHPTVYADLSEIIQRPWQLYNALVLAHQSGVMGQILFGSNFPFLTPERAIVTIYSVNTLVQGTHLPSVPREQLRSIVERDALACLGLDTPARRKGAATGEGEATSDGGDDTSAGDEEAAAPPKPSTPVVENPAT